MNISDKNRPGGRFPLRAVMVTLAMAGALVAVPAWADSDGAKAAIVRADAKIEMVTRQAGLAGNYGDQSFNMARQRVASARLASKNGNYDDATMMADEASLLAELTAERANLAALKTRYDGMAGPAMPSITP